ncbi:MAG: tetratricopeptide repeat protein [Proteobacteria bacterium]|nr:tetratricopeptide repeat protein [Pseudomonadota bacterium]
MKYHLIFRNNSNFKYSEKFALSFHILVFFTATFLSLIPAIPVIAETAKPNLRTTVTNSIVSPEEMISDFEARHTLARILSYNNATLRESLHEYNILLESSQDNMMLHLETGDIYFRMKQYDMALKEFNMVLKKDSNNIRARLSSGKTYLLQQKYREAEIILKQLQPDALILSELGDMEASVGHVEKCIDYYNRALALKHDKDLNLRFADQMMGWGDFYRAERIYRNYIKFHPDSTETKLKLASLLKSSQRFEQAESIYRMLLTEGKEKDKALFGLAELKYDEKDFTKSLIYLDLLLSENPNHEKSLYLKGKALAFTKNYDEALKNFDVLSRISSKEAISFLEKGKIYLKLGDDKKACLCFAEAFRIDGNNPEIIFYNKGHQKATPARFIKDILEKNRKNPQALMNWGNMFASNGFRKEAINCYRTIIIEDPAFFHARLALAETLAANSQYDESIKHFKELSKIFPENSKILISLARVLGWSKHYRQSVDLYTEINRLNPGDFVCRREKARTAMWGKMYDIAMAAYDEILTPRTDQKLADGLKPLCRQTNSHKLSAECIKLHKTAENGSVYKGYETIMAESDAIKNSLESDRALDLERKLIELSALYKIQKSAFLEKEAKRLSWEKRFIPSMEVFEKLISFTPGNEEALFDYAQIQCALGLCDRESAVYQNLLHIDPMHSLAPVALSILEKRSWPLVGIDYFYWHEKGRGELSQIARNRYDLTAQIPFMCRYRFETKVHHWVEKPDFTDQSYHANGFSIAFRGVLSAIVSAEAKWTHKKYSKEIFGTTDTGDAGLWFNLRNYAHVGIGYEKSDELYNYFGIRQKAQAETWSLATRSDITRHLELTGKARYIDYNDNNEGYHHSLGIGYAFTDHPRIFKVTLSENYRDTAKDSLYIYNGPALIDITHPYWTPENYFGTDINFQWHHDLSEYFLCGNENKYYDIRISFGAGNDGNSSAQIDGKWHHEISDYLTFEINAMLHRSNEWDAESISGKIQLRF